jgi:hypothetical protein
MNTSAAQIVKNYLDKYICTNLVKTRKQKYTDQPCARKTLSVAFNISHEMDNLIRSNNANDLPAIQSCLREQIAFMRQELQDRQTFYEKLFRKTALPPDFDRCLHEAWHKIQDS